MRMRSRSDQRSAGTSVRACEPTRSSACTSSLSRAQSVTAAVISSIRVLTFSKQALVDLQHRGVDAAKRELAARDARLELAGASPSCRRPAAARSAARPLPRRALGAGRRVTSGQSTGSTMQTSCRGGAQSGDHTVTGARSTDPSSSTGNGSSSRLPASRPREPRHRPRAGRARRARRASLRGSARAPSASRSARTRRRRGGSRWTAAHFCERNSSRAATSSASTAGGPRIAARAGRAPRGCGAHRPERGPTWDPSSPEGRSRGGRGSASPSSRAA